MSAGLLAQKPGWQVTLENEVFPLWAKFADEMPSPSAAKAALRARLQKFRQRIASGSVIGLGLDGADYEFARTTPDKRDGGWEPGWPPNQLVTIWATAFPGGIDNVPPKFGKYLETCCLGVPANEVRKMLAAATVIACHHEAGHAMEESGASPTPKQMAQWEVKRHTEHLTLWCYLKEKYYPLTLETWSGCLAFWVKTFLERGLQFVTKEANC